ncbi:hypothetical protein BDV95DRAFT_360535 [Massariosphaeria phaeospora]|uniref:DUF7514 domain-containing protein n=1 Tax=Massariosphaeria phaeospora TaxID=100035 RepID=A0A7C8MAI4_9PLEO|nr:hypothetical protein BDV95DRAFT_360535 [Massariosphaeria phaeospora]
MAAYDGYRNPQDYPSSYNNTYDSRSYQPSSYRDETAFNDVSRPRSRSSSNNRSDGLRQQPLNTALNNAFEHSDTARAVHPDVIAQITAEVKRSLLNEIKLNGVGGAIPQPQPTHAPPPPHPQSPTDTSASFPTRNVYTPPSPRHPDYSSYGSASPDPSPPDRLYDGTDEKPTPRVERSIPIDIPHDSTARSRPVPASRMSQDFSPIEKMWQHLFDAQGQPTPRLGQFLRGLAVHLIDDYEPKGSLVITPAKMLKFYDDVKLHDENYPWHMLFGKPSSTLSKIYREMRCQHHLVQENPAAPPEIPALTPDGFQEWMTVMILAYPDAEFERLSKAVLDMPISNADNSRERFPKELPRRLFPSQENLQAQQRCAAILSAEGVGPLRRAPTFPPPPPPPMDQSTGSIPNLERERSPYVSQPDSRAVYSDDEYEEPLSIPLERERKPYASAPGGGKVYNDPSSSMHSESSVHDQRRRAQSTTNHNQWAPPSGVASQPQHHPRTASNVAGRRPRSPSFSSYGTRSDPSVRDIPGSYYSSNMHDPEEENRRFAKDADSKRSEWARRHAEDESGGAHHRRSTNATDNPYDPQPRSAYDSDYYGGRGGTNGYDSKGYEPRRY